MAPLQTTEQIGWGLGIFLRIFLPCLLIFRKNVRSFPFLSAYLFVNLIQGLAVLLAYKTWGRDSWPSYWVAWSGQAVVVCARGLAVADLCRFLLGRYRGIWSLAWRVLMSCAGIILLYSSVSSDRTLRGAVIGANRALELAIATVIVVLFIFLRHYEVVSESSVRLLALGFCFYSCIEVLNYTVLERFASAYPIWSALGVFTYLFSLLVWTWALRKTIPRPFFAPALLSRSVYQQISPEINARLRALNEQLIHFWRLEAPRP
jgi:hypothetical protein